MTGPNAIDRASAAHRARWGAPEFVVRAPGRVNLIGDHTDYSDGFTLPMALPFDTAIAMTSAGDPLDGPVQLTSEGFGEVTIDPIADPRATASWARHVAGVIDLLREKGIASGGWRATVASDIPAGASLSSSAAIEVAVITMLLARAGTSWSPVEIAKLGRRVENEVVGIPSGIMDQLISAGATAGCASLMDCRTLTLTPQPIPAGALVAIMDTGTRRVLADAAYGERRAACEQAVQALGVAALRDATIDQVEAITDPVVRRRARHVVHENRRTVDAASALQRGDVGDVGRLMSASHLSLRDDFEVSGPGLDAIVEVAQRSPGCLGARMTGGGFAGCAVALIRADAAEGFVEHVVHTYRHDGHAARVWICAPAAGASVAARAI
ncbi:MAG: galactokinase [Ilumatobacteraceae bacterium]